ncbi:TrmH family RNA methyltransferase [Schleiferilactobacillus perolens]|uniref:RNA methyltransferase, TrmH family n=1 Tax=Schleiferilactobacillus perolens DSM 12744 TaxID=1423792 RepID=A0A0R1MXM4_9LACO|nr:RNA methyltransferase [Schleiferilactobacillus perolens]KRL12895.1 RNA methyltransferase, TrmH family [Schleiferilactobacillus perolens DSM 12744]MCI2171858.1 RNA methyltransferase [Schleiferilactobacillus perolens]
MEYIESIRNEQIKNAVKLQTKKYQIKENAYFLEGPHLINEAVAAGVPLQQLLITENHEDDHVVKQYYDNSWVIADNVAKHLAATETNQGMFAIAPIPTMTLPEQISGGWLLLDAVQDPGNVGTMIRTADAAGYAGVIIGTGTAWPFNPKVVRAMQGSQFHLRLVQMPLADAIAQFQAAQAPVYGTLVNQDAVDYRTVKPTGTFGLVIGNEGNGMNPELAKETTANLVIPLPGKAESLNAAIAAGVLMFQMV